MHFSLDGVIVLWVFFLPVGVTSKGVIVLLLLAGCWPRFGFI